MSVQAVVPFDFNGEKFFTHTSWFSEKQYNAWANIPEENKNLAFYYGLSTVSLFAIVKNLSSSFSAGPVSSDPYLVVTVKFSLEWVVQLQSVILVGWLSLNRKKGVKSKELFLRMNVVQPLFGEARQV